MQCLPKEFFNPKKRDHLESMHLLGDPLIKPLRPKQMVLRCQPKVDAGKVLTIEGSVKQAGELVLELAYRRDRFKQRFSRRRKFDNTKESLRSYQKAYDQARDLVWSQVKVDLEEPGKFEVEIPVSGNMEGECCVRARMEVDSETGPGVILGAVRVFVEKKQGVRTAQKQ